MFLKKLKLTELNSSLAEIESEHYHHPGLRNVSFIFCDNQPNDNGQGVQREDFAEVMRSAIGTPIKMKFLGQTVSGHVGSIPIGFIESMKEVEVDAEKNIYQLVANGVLFAHEYPDEIEYLEESFAEGKAPGISFEMGYRDELKDKGITWLKNLVTRAATFVRTPAYGNRTALLALASNTELNTEEFIHELAELVAKSPKISDEGGNNIVEKELEEAKAKIAELEKLLAESKASAETAVAENVTLTAENTTLQTSLKESNDKLAEYAEKEKLASRTEQLVEAGLDIKSLDADKLAKKQVFWASLSDDAFAEYKDDLQAALKEKKAEASLLTRRTAPATKIVSDPDREVSVASMKERFASFSRTNSKPE